MRADDAPDAPTVGEHVVYSDVRDVGDAVEATITYEIPDAVTRLAFWIEHPEVTVVETDGFERSDVAGYTWQGGVDGPAFEWDGSGGDARVVLRQPVVDARDDTAATYGGGTEDWALLLRPRTHTRWRYEGSEPQIDRRAAVAGAGVAGEQFAFLGPHRCVERSVADERLRLVVPEAADPVAAPSAILDSLAAASERLQVGGRNPVVTVFVAPTAGVEWDHRGLSLGPDARVNDAAPLVAPTNIWVHEYVHTRQDRAGTTAATEWLLEATAEYYAATHVFERGAIDYTAYRRVLARGIDDGAASATLADPVSWSDDAQYRKGALVVAALDRRIRAATGGEASFQAVLRAWNRAETFDADAFADAVEAAGGPAARAAAIAYTQSPTTPACWSASAHAATFEVPAACGIDDPTSEAAATGDPLADRATIPPG